MYFRPVTCPLIPTGLSGSGGRDAWIEDYCEMSSLIVIGKEIR